MRQFLHSDHSNVVVDEPGHISQELVLVCLHVFDVAWPCWQRSGT